VNHFGLACKYNDAYTTESKKPGDPEDHTQELKLEDHVAEICC
jgi:hypothetical protein